jgi:hypothetical protein
VFITLTVNFLDYELKNCGVLKKEHELSVLPILVLITYGCFSMITSVKRKRGYELSVFEDSPLNEPNSHYLSAIKF